MARRRRHGKHGRKGRHGHYRSKRDDDDDDSPIVSEPSPTLNMEARLRQLMNDRFPLYRYDGLNIGVVAPPAKSRSRKNKEPPVSIAEAAARPVRKIRLVKE